MRAVHGALQAAFKMEQRGFTNWWNACTGASQQTRIPFDGEFIALSIGSLRTGVHNLLDAALDISTVGAWQRLRVTCAIAEEEEAALCHLMQRNAAEMLANAGLTGAMAKKTSADRQQRAASDLARFGLRTCALPECDAVEPHPKAFKVCSRCRAACYCSAAHQQADWRRHKRADGCAAAAGAAGQ